MTLELPVLIFILVAHWICDFITQTDWQAKNKCKNIMALISHTTTYTAYMAVMIFFFYVPFLVDEKPEGFGLKVFHVIITTFIAHTATDFITSKITNKLYTKGKIHQFFVVIGFDQVLHYIQLFLVFAYLGK